MQEHAARGNLTLKTLTMPADTNPYGDIFGGWLMAQMDLAAGICAGQKSQTRVVTVAVEKIEFLRPVKVGDVLSIFTEVKNVGNTSMEIHVEAWVRRGRHGDGEKVTEANFKFVAVDDKGKPTPVIGV